MLDTYCEYYQDNHECAFGYGTLFHILILCEEEQRSQADLLNIQANEYVLERFGEEKSACIARTRLVELPEEEIFPKVVE